MSQVFLGPRARLQQPPSVNIKDPTPMINLLLRSTLGPSPPGTTLLSPPLLRAPVDTPLAPPTFAAPDALWLAPGPLSQDSQRPKSSTEFACCWLRAERSLALLCVDRRATSARPTVECFLLMPGRDAEETLEAFGSRSTPSERRISADGKARSSLRTVFLISAKHSTGRPLRVPSLARLRRNSQC